ncbi:97b9e420-7938-4c8b-b566-2824404605bd [Sclerotinia trifoliorum]|uniref:97b9e420-7938-4c8b-b566-2824404605bd n=1 Tax=Sclerotinia trifoliorum TaxID=28548 RepID=A0A8H2W2C2_9HELO|nr:97b9e420-7938-4c8b-b566-2824404605bd [Sclerotinia trifoliorum]
MAEALGVASSMAGLISLADTVVQRGYKYIRDVKDAEKSVHSLIEEVNSLAGVLHSLNNVVQELEAADSTSHSCSRIQHINSCQTTLENIVNELDNATPEVKSISQRLKWPFKKGTIAELLKEVQNHKNTMTIAMSARQILVCFN